VPHLGAAEAARAASEGGAGRLILTHIQPDANAHAALDRARALFAEEVLLARPDLRVDF
jgi:ribonuclease BN (tRNA processing enzyme)